MSVFDEFRSLVARVDADIDLAEGCALICEAAGHDGARTVVADQLQALDTMVSGSSVRRRRPEPPNVYISLVQGWCAG